MGDDCSHGKQARGAIEMAELWNWKTKSPSLLAMILVVTSYSYLLVAPVSTTLSRAAAMAMVAG